MISFFFLFFFFIFRLCLFQVRMKFGKYFTFWCVFGSTCKTWSNWKSFPLTVKFKPFNFNIIYTFHLPSNQVTDWKTEKRESGLGKSPGDPPKPESSYIAPPHSPPCTDKYSISFSSTLFSFLPWLFFSPWTTSAPPSYSNPSPISMPRSSTACTRCT